jgi:hypothetical protein
VADIMSGESDDARELAQWIIQTQSPNAAPQGFGGRDSEHVLRAREGTNRRPADAAPALEAENAALRHDLDRAMANHVADINAPSGPSGEASEWLIWSNEHHAWWGPDRCGYPPQPHLAGRYTLTEARNICHQRHWLGGSVPPETMLHQDEVPPSATSGGQK